MNCIALIIFAPPRGNKKQLCLYSEMPYIILPRRGEAKNTFDFELKCFNYFCRAAGKQKTALSFN